MNIFLASGDLIEEIVTGTILMMVLSAGAMLIGTIRRSKGRTKGGKSKKKILPKSAVNDIEGNTSFRSKTYIHQKLIIDADTSHDAVTEIHEEHSIILNDLGLKHFENDSFLSSQNIISSAQKIHEFSQESATFITQSIEKPMSEKLVHFFYDYYIVSLFKKSKLMQHGNDIALSVVDTMHIHHYGPPSEIVITGSAATVWALPENFSCFYRTFIAQTKKGDLDIEKLTSFATYCIGEVDNLSKLFIAEKLPVIIKESGKLIR